MAEKPEIGERVYVLNWTEQRDGDVVAVGPTAFAVAWRDDRFDRTTLEAYAAEKYGAYVKRGAQPRPTCDESLSDVIVREFRR